MKKTQLLKLASEHLPPEERTHARDLAFSKLSATDQARLRELEADADKLWRNVGPATAREILAAIGAVMK